MNRRGKGEDSTEIIDRLLSRADSPPILLYKDEKALCPSCGSRTLAISEYLYTVPYFNKIVITIGSCASCGYKFRDIRLAEASSPKKIEIRIESEKELSYLVAKSPLAALAIKELDVNVVPGRASLGFITTVEGIVDRFIEVARSVCPHIESASDRGLCEKTLEKLLLVKEGRLKATIVICDYDGMSKVVGEGVRESEIDDECLDLKPTWL